MSRHVQNTDASVLERRLRPIYDWLDTGNNKKALQECDKVLKKTPNLHCAKALRALTLLRMGRQDETSVILDNLSSEKPTDEATLQAMALCYRDMQKLQRICKLYEQAVKIDPTNEELLSHLFMSYVRIGDFKAQQQSAMALYKQKPKNPYYCWSVKSIVLQATRGDGAKDEAKRKVLLCLPERMMQKLIDDNKIEAEQEVQLYLMVLELQQKYETILEVLDSSLGEKLQSANIPQMKLTYLKKLKRWPQVNILCKSILNESLDKWDIWKDYIQSVFELSEVGMNGDSAAMSDNELDSLDNTAEKCHEFICGIIEGGAHNSFLLRGPYLARFEVCAKLQEHGAKTADILGDTIELFIEYFRKFGHKPCCVSDLRIYLKLLDCDQKSDLATKLVKEVGISSTSVPQSADQMQRHIGALQLSRLCGAHRNFSPEHLRALVTALTLHYQHGYQSYGKNLPPTDIGPSDNYALLATHILYDLSRKEAGGENYLVAAVALLESLLKNSPSNFHAKLLALKFYHILGDVIRAETMYTSLDVKHLQLDSLGYVHCGRLATTAQFNLCSVHFDATLKFFSSNYRDNTDHLTFFYKYGSFVKLDEFMDFRDRLNNSIHYTSVVIDRILLSLMDCTTLENLYNLDISPREDKIDWEVLRDNRDLNAYVTWEPEFAHNSVEDNEQIKKLFAQDLFFLKLRTHILWCLSAATEVLKSLDGTRQKNIDSLRKFLNDWKDLEDGGVSQCDMTPVSEDLVAFPPSSRLQGYLQVPYRSVIAALLQLFLSLCGEDAVQVQEACAHAEEQINAIARHLAGKTNSESSDFREKRKELELLVNNVELVSISSVICMICSELLVKPASTKKSKKKQPSESKSKDLLNSIVNQLKLQIDKLNELVEICCLNIKEGDLVDLFDALNLNIDGRKCRNSVILSYVASGTEIQTVLKKELKLLESL